MEVDRAFCLDSNTRFAVGFTIVYITPEVGDVGVTILSLIMLLTTSNNNTRVYSIIRS